MADKESYDSWEVGAFEEDANNTTWPPRSYTCSFCTREFRSAQALGGHMNVHRRDKARLHQPPPASISITPSTTALIMNSTQHQGLRLPNAGLCLLYPLPNPNAGLVKSRRESPPSSCLSTKTVFSPTFLPPYHTTTCSTTSSINKFVVPAAIKFSAGQYSSNIEQSAASTIKDNFGEDYYNKGCGGICEGEIDLELRLGCGSSNS